MTRERDIERLLDHWFAGGPSEAPDRVIDVVADRIGHQSQRPTWRLHWRIFDMTPAIKFGAAIAAVVVIALIGFNMLSGRGDSSVGGPSASPSPSPGASGAPSTPPSPSGADSSGIPWSMTGTLPAGWSQGMGGDFGISDATYLEIMFDRSVMEANCELRPEPGIGRTANDIATTLASRPGLVASGRQDVSVGGLSGVQLDLEVAPGWTKGCEGATDLTSPAVPTIGALDEKNYWGYNAAISGEQIRYIILDTPGGGNVVIAVIVTDPDKAADHLLEAMSIVDSIEFDVGP